MKKAFFAQCIIVLVFGFSNPTLATTFYVDADSTNPQPPYNQSLRAAQTLSQALPYAVDGDRILVMAGTYNLTSELVVNQSIEIVSANGPETTIINGAQNGTCFNLGTTACTISGFTLKNGTGHNSDGGGVYCEDTTPLITNCIFTANSCTDEGGGIYYGTAIDCIFSNNIAYNGGAAAYSQLIDCQIEHNQVSNNGGGIYRSAAERCNIGNNNSKVGGGLCYGSATDCTIQNNKSTQTWSTGGGGAYSANITNCVVRENFAMNNGGGLNGGTAVNCSVSANSANGDGGGAYQTTAIHSTFTGNSSTAEGGGMNRGTAKNCILWYNTAATGNNIQYTSVLSSCAPELTHGNNGCITNTPQLTSPSHIATTSPCLGAGDAAYSTGIDIDGQSWQAAPAMGCDEIIGGSITGPIVPTLTGPSRVAVGQDVWFSASFEGAITRDQIDNGNGFIGTRMFKPFKMHWSSPGYYNVILTGFNDDHPGGVSITHLVEVRSAADSTIYVSPNGHDHNDGSSWSLAKRTIQMGINAQHITGGRVLVSNGVYSVASAIVVDKEIRIQSLNGAALTEINGNSQKRLFNLKDSACILDGFTLTDGGTYSADNSSNGGTVYCEATTPEVKNCIFDDNHGNGGGAMWRGTARDCIFRNNSGGNGPGALRAGIAIDCLFENNHGLGGGSGGGAMSGGIATRCIFRNNTNLKAGGAMYNGTAIDCQFLGNHTTHTGGGMHGGTAINCAFNGNKAVDNGGGTYTTKATNCTITDNRAENGGGMHGGTADNCIVYYNQALHSGNDMKSVTALHSCSPDLEDGVDGNITATPLLISASRIVDSSPCVGAGDPTLLMSATDLDGENWNTAPAIGCDEPAASLTGDLSIKITGPSNVPAGFRAYFKADIQGALASDYVEFGDGQTAIHAGVREIHHVWNSPGLYNFVITAYNDDYPGGYAVTKQVRVYESDFAATYVSPTGNDEANGHSWATAKQTIQAAIDAQELPGGQVILADGVYEIDATILVEKEIQLIGLNGAEHTIIDGGSTNNYTGVGCLDIADNHTTVRGITFRNGRDRNSTKYYSGGGVFCNYSLRPRISDCVFAGNSATEGGALAYGIAVDCIFTNNWSWNGSGGATFLSHAFNCEFVGNSSRDQSGAVHSGIASDCTFRENTTGGYGGGMRYGTANGCTFENNTANYGGGMADGVANDCWFNKNTGLNAAGGMNKGIANRCFFLGNLSLGQAGGMENGTANSCAFSGNKAESYGGALAYTTANHCTITANESGEKGGGMFSGNANSCIAWLNTAVEEGNDLYSAHPNHTCSPDATHGENGCITNNPLLVSSSHIAVNSPCIYQANIEHAAEFDIDGAAWLNPPAMGCDQPDMATSDLVDMELIGPILIREHREGTYLALFDGETKMSVVDFADGTIVTNPVGPLVHSWPAGSYDVVLTAYNADHQQGLSFTQRVEVASAFTSTQHVDPTGDDANSGLNWANPKRTLEAAIDAQDIYGGYVFIRGTHHITETVEIDKAVHLKSELGLGVIDAGGSNRCFNLGYSECVLENLTIQNGVALASGNNKGGGVYCDNTTPQLIYCTITNCTAYSGAGSHGGSLKTCTLAENTASTHGGGAYKATLTNSTIRGNVASHGGGVSESILNACILKNNTATTAGGAAYTSQIYFSTINSNSAPSGGGLHTCTIDRCDVFNNEATIADGGGMNKGTATSSTIHHNRAVRYGGGGYYAALNNCTIADNTADQGGGTYGDYIKNTIVWNNTAVSAYDNIRYSSSAYNSCSSELSHGSNGNITNAPMFITYPEGFLTRGSAYYLANLSPCINGGDNARVSSEKDYNGWDRIIHGTVDIGACEMWLGGDSDSDGIGDAWELENFGGVTNAVATDHSDSDPHNNYEEYVAGTDPFDGNSYLRITQLEMTNSNVVLHWNAVEHRAYQVLWTDSLTNEYQEVRPAVRYPQDSYTLENTNAPTFYKIKVWID